jgi:hypothetical protein
MYADQLRIARIAITAKIGMICYKTKSKAEPQRSQSYTKETKES